MTVSFYRRLLVVLVVMPRTRIAINPYGFLIPKIRHWDGLQWYKLVEMGGPIHPSPRHIYTEHGDTLS
jgi:hypothetical protein